MYNIRTYELTTVLGDRVVMNYRENTSDRDTISAIMIYDEYLTKQFKYRDNDVFIDIGSHIGTWGILMAIHNPTFQVYCYEPIPENYELINMNIRANKLENVIPFNRSVSENSEGAEAIRYTEDSTPFGQTHKFIGCVYNPDIDAQGKGRGDKIYVKKTSIDDIFTNNNIEECRVLKCDCEGCECRSFKNASPETLRKIDYIIGEFHSREGMDFYKFYSLFKPYFIDVSYRIQKPSDPFNPHFCSFLLKNKGLEE